MDITFRTHNHKTLQKALLFLEINGYVTSSGHKPTQLETSSGHHIFLLRPSLIGAQNFELVKGSHSGLDTFGTFYKKVKKGEINVYY